MQFNDKGLALIKEFEGCKLTAYQDIVGVWTIGYGQTGDVSEGDTITQEQADDLLSECIDNEFVPGVTNLLTICLTDNQFSALVCFAYNVGLNNLKNSHLLMYVNKGMFDLASGQFERWDRAGGQEIPGLLRRRQAEKNLFLS